MIHEVNQNPQAKSENPNQTKKSIFDFHQFVEIERKRKRIQLWPMPLRVHPIKGTKKKEKNSFT